MKTWLKKIQNYTGDLEDKEEIDDLVLQQKYAIKLVKD
jgi:hypothetical protein